MPGTTTWEMTGVPVIVDPSENLSRQAYSASERSDQPQTEVSKIDLPVVIWKE